VCISINWKNLGLCIHAQGQNEHQADMKKIKRMVGERKTCLLADIILDKSDGATRCGIVTISQLHGRKRVKSSTGGRKEMRFVAIQNGKRRLGAEPLRVSENHPR
jgi:hypothetical protein